MLAVGLHDGNIAVYNLQKKGGNPVYQSDPRNGKHKDVVWQVKIKDSKHNFKKLKVYR